MKNLRKNNLDELTELMPTISKIKQSGYLGGMYADPIPTDPYAQPVGGGGNSYTLDEAQAMINSGTWQGGVVNGIYMNSQVVVTAFPSEAYSLSELLDSTKSSWASMSVSYIYSELPIACEVKTIWDALNQNTRVDFIKQIMSAGYNNLNDVVLISENDRYYGQTWSAIDCHTGREITRITNESVLNIPVN